MGLAHLQVATVEDANLVFSVRQEVEATRDDGASRSLEAPQDRLRGKD